MNQKQLSILVVLGLVLGVIGLVVSKSRQRDWQSSSAGNIDKVLPDFPLNDITTVKIKDAVDNVTLEKKDGIWTIADRENYPASYAEIGEFLQIVWDLKPTKQERVGESQYGRIEVRVPGEDAGDGTGMIAEFIDKSGKQVGALVLGKQIMRESQPNPMFGGAGGGEFPVGRYVRTVGEEDQVFLVSETFRSIRADAASWLDRAFIKIAKPKSITVASDSDPEMNWQLTRDSDTADWTLVDPQEGEVLASSKVSGLKSVLSSPSFGDVNKESFEPEFTAQIETFEGFAYDLKVGAKSDDDKRLVQISVGGSFPESREAEEDESEEDKTTKDQEFADTQKELKEKLATEQAYADWTYSVSNWTFTSLAKKRSELLEPPPEPEEEEEAAVEAVLPDLLSGEEIDPLAPVLGE